MPFFKDVWRGMTKPDKPNAFMQQYAAGLLAGGGSKGPLARMGAKLAGGLLAGGQRRATETQRKGILADRTKFLEAQRPQKQSLLTASPVPIMTPLKPLEMDPTSPMLYDPGKSTPLALEEGETATMVDHLEEADPWKSIMIGVGSEDPMLQQAAFQMANERRSKGDVIMQSPTGEMYVWDGKDAGTIRYLMGGTPKIPESKIVKNNIVERAPDGTWAVKYEGGDDQDISIRTKKEDAVKDGYTWTETWEEGVDKNTGAVVWKSNSHSTLKTQQTQEGAISLGGDKTYVRSLQEMLDASEDMQIRYGRIKTKLADPIYGSEYKEFFTALGGVEQWWNKTKSWLGITDENHPDFKKAQRISGFIGDVAETANLYIKQITGAQMSEAEATRLLKAIATVSDDPASFAGKFESAMERMQTVIDTYKGRLAALKKAGYSQVEATQLATEAAQREVSRVVDYYDFGAGATDSGEGGPGAYRPPGSTE